MATILFISYDGQFRERLEKALITHGHTFIGLPKYEQAFNLPINTEIDAVAVDVRYMKRESSSFCRELRQAPTVIDKPIMLITPPIDAAQAAVLLDSGADDLLRYPFEDREFLARLRAMLRHVLNPNNSRTPNLRLIEQQHTVFIDQRRITLTPVEFQLLNFLCQNQDRYYTADELLNTLWNYPPKSGDTALVRNHIRNLRRKLEQDPDHPQVLISRYGQGYTICADIHPA